jgi:hypothetical protein
MLMRLAARARTAEAGQRIFSAGSPKWSATI